ncbi:hypothetical protein CTI12_AA362280 [Artemisia annua]|uniref:Uncharacterized protein n=1 Tax=Artemisia annua TaxID=35608 RepID=A0A2U1MN18_ARTAN|nr:hypothetical protein CTI12_AA362280 [Artemisia annua]
MFNIRRTHMYASGGIAVSCVVVPITQICDPQPKCEAWCVRVVWIYYFVPDESGLHMNENGFWILGFD